MLKISRIHSSSSREFNHQVPLKLLEQRVASNNFQRERISPSMPSTSPPNNIQHELAVDLAFLQVPINLVLAHQGCNSGVGTPVEFDDMLRTVWLYSFEKPVSQTVVPPDVEFLLYGQLRKINCKWSASHFPLGFSTIGAKGVVDNFSACLFY